MSADIDELMRKHQMGEYENPSIISELKEMTFFLIFAILIGSAFILILGSIFSLIILKDFSGTLNYSGNVSLIIFILTGIYVAYGVMAGTNAFMGEASRRAWTGVRNPMENPQKDLRGFLQNSRIFYGLFVSALVTLLTIYFYQN